MIKAVIFDLNGIFLRNPALNERSKKESNIPVKKFISKFEKEEKVSKIMVSFSKKLKDKGIKVFILSNTLKEIAEYYEHYPWIHKAVDKVYFSFQTGFKKPDKRAWENILSDNYLKPEECIYFDDQDKNLKACQSLGIKAFLFTNEKKLQDIINEEIRG